MRTKLHDDIGLVLFGKAKRAILSRLLGEPDRRFYVRELARAAGLTPSTLTRDLSALSRAGVIIRAQEGRHVYYQADSSSPVFSELRGLVTKTFGIADVLRKTLKPVGDRVQVAAIYGSVAKGEHGSGSDVDLLIVGDVTSSEIADELLSAEESIGRSISPTTYPATEFRAQAKVSPFLKAILQQPMIFLIGDKNELKRIRESQASHAR